MKTSTQLTKNYELGHLHQALQATNILSNIYSFIDGFLKINVFEKHFYRAYFVYYFINSNCLFYKYLFTYHICRKIIWIRYNFFTQLNYWNLSSFLKYRINWFCWSKLDDITIFKFHDFFAKMTSEEDMKIDFFYHWNFFCRILKSVYQIKLFKEPSNNFIWNFLY